MGETPDQSVSDGAGPVRETRAYRPRQFRTDLTVPVPVLEDGDERHGTMNGYVNFRCRCPPCKTARSDYDKQSRAKAKEAAA